MTILSDMAKDCHKIVTKNKTERFNFVKSVKMAGAPGAIRTPDLLNRNQMLYPAELRVPEGEEHHDACNPLKGQ